MLIPIETKGQRVVITLSITVKEPVVLGVLVYDPSHSHTHYMRRKVPFTTQKHRVIKLPLPVSPEHALLEIYNKEKPAQDAGFKLDSYRVDALPQQQVWSTPERHRFMDFTIDFAQKAGYVPTGFYHSPGYEFLIHYVPRITDELNQELVTPARIQRHMPRVQISQKLFTQFSIPVRVAILSHEGCHFFLNTRSEKEADLCGIRYYLDAGFPAIEAFYAASQVFLAHADTVGKGHLQRTQDIDQFIRQYKAQKEIQL